MIYCRINAKVILTYELTPILIFDVFSHQYLKFDNLFLRIFAINMRLDNIYELLNNEYP